MQIPEILATFELDPQGEPAAVERDGLAHYRIRLQIRGAPEDTYAVTYLLDDSYYDPVRESLDRQHDFSEELTSYGDYTVQAKVRTKQGTVPVARSLSEALKAGHTESISPAIDKALQEIRAK